MSSIKSKLILALVVFLSLVAGMAAVLSFGAESLQQNAAQTREANDEVRDLLAFALSAHRYVGAFGQSLGQRTLATNNERRQAAKVFDSSMSEMAARRAGREGHAVSWDALRAISGEMDRELKAADAQRADGKFYEAEVIFNRTRKTQFEQRMLPWFEAAINAQRSERDVAEAKALGQANTLRTTAKLLACLAALLATVAAAAMMRTVVRPIKLVMEGAEALARGELAHRVAYRGADDVGILAERLNAMAERIEHSRSALIEKNAALEEAYQLQSEFLALISHELRSPLNSIIGYTELVAEDSRELSPLGQKNVLAIATSARRLLSLINDILDLSKLRAGRMTARCESFSAVELAELVAEDGEALVQRRDIHVSCRADERPLRVRSDETKVRQILTNLVSNAVKFTERGSVTVSVRRLRSDGVHFTVADTGIGIAEQQLELVFEPFRQVQGGQGRAVGGTGLGLAIVKRLVDLLGGQVEVHSVVGKGTEFTVSLPALDSE